MMMQTRYRLKNKKLLAGKKNESKSWVVESVTVNGTELQLEACDADNIFTF